MKHANGQNAEILKEVTLPVGNLRPAARPKVQANIDSVLNAAARMSLYYNLPAIAHRSFNSWRIGFDQPDAGYNAGVYYWVNVSDGNINIKQLRAY